MRQPILVLGANGFIGSAVVTGLASTTWAAPIQGVRGPPSRQDQFEHRTVDATSIESVSAAIRGVAGIVNCVAGDELTIVRSAEILFDVAQRSDPPPRIIHLSSMAVYGGSVGLVNETAPLRGDLGPYSKAKVAAEASAASYPRIIIFRPGCVFGPGSEQWSIRIARLLLAGRLGDLGACGDGFCNVVHIDDVVLAITRALERSDLDGHVFNLSTRDPPTWNQFLVRYATALRAVPVRRISRRRLRIETKVLAPPLKIAEILARVCRLPAGRLPPFIPPSVVRLMEQEIRLDTGRAEADLGLRSRDIDLAIEQTATWFLAHSSVV